MNIGFKRQLDSLKDESNSSIFYEKLVKENEILKEKIINLYSTLNKFMKEKYNLNWFQVRVCLVLR